MIFSLFDRIATFHIKDIIGFVSTNKSIQIDYYLT